jgi:hypothetical protein
VATSDIDAEQLISRFCGALAPSDRAAFRAAAESALTQLPYSGPGIAYRCLRELFRGYFHPPPDPRIGAPRGPMNRRPSKLISAEAIGGPDPREGARDRRRFQAV